MANDDYGYFGKGSTGYAQYMTAFNRNFWRLVRRRMRRVYWICFRSAPFYCATARKPTPSNTVMASSVCR